MSTDACKSVALSTRNAPEVMNEPLVSVVTPVYNTGEFLEQAIRSVLEQTYRNFEYIICNNHSTDESGEIAARYEALDPRIRVVQPPHFLPQAQNFNFALQQISPESRYTKIILADDWLFSNCLQEMVARAEMSPKIGIVSSYNLIETEVHGSGLPVDKKVIAGRTVGRLHMLEGVWLFGSQSTVMYSSDVVRARAPRFYPEDRFYYDTDTAFQILVDHDFGFVHQVLTFSRHQPGSITHNERDYLSREIDRVLYVHQYGQIYLTPDEFERTMSNAWRAYYGALGRQWLLDRFGKTKPQLWEYHKKRLAGINMKIDPKRLAIAAAKALAREAAMPGELVWRLIQERRPRERPWDENT
jgi:glycosyltransferase involved in cell wall biosynthesis